MPIKLIAEPIWEKENAKSFELFIRGIGPGKINSKLVTFEEIPNLNKPFTNEQFKEYASKYGVDCAQEFLDCCDYGKPIAAYQIINPPKFSEIWDNPKINLWFKSVFGKELIYFSSGILLYTNNVYSFDLFKFESYLSRHFKYHPYSDVSIRDFMVKIFGGKNVDEFERLFLTHEEKI